MTFEPVYEGALNVVEDIVQQIDAAKNKLPGLIFNYPPIPLWKPPQTDQLSIDSIWIDNNIYTNNLYIHIPFCRQKCSFCYYSVVPGASHDHIEAYLDCLEKEAVYYSGSTYLKKKMDTVFVGGGTPSLLNESQIVRLFSKIINRFDVSSTREITFECAPDSITLDKLKLLKSLGVTRISMGVQSFDDNVLSKTRRDGNSEKVIDRYYDVVTAGIDKVNIDLIAGVEKESMNSMANTMNTLLNLNPKPTQVTLFTLSVRKGSINHKYLGGDPVSQFEESFESYKYARDRLVEDQYWQYSRNLFPTNDKIFQYQDNIWGRNGYVLALGVSGYSHSQNAVYQNAFNTKMYMERVAADELPIDKIYPLFHAETLRRHLVMAMKHTRLNLDEVRHDNPDSVELLNSFEPIFEALERKKIITRDGAMVKYTSQGVAMADKYARLFFSEDVNQCLREMDFDSRNKRDSFNFTV